MDQLPKIIEAAHKNDIVRVLRPRRPDRLAKELQKHLPNHIVTVEDETVVIRSLFLGARGCSVGPVCNGAK